MAKNFGQQFPVLTNPADMVSISPLQAFSMQPQDMLEYLKKFAMAYPPFWWQFDFVNIPANTPVSVLKTVQNDSYFFAVYMIVQAKSPAATNTFLLEIKDTGKSLSYMDEPLRSPMISGTATEPFYFPSPLLFEPTSKWSLIVTDTSGVADNEVHIIIGGSKIHK